MTEVLAALVAEARRRKLQGIVILSQSSDGQREFLAACIDCNGKVCDPRNWNIQDSIPAALVDLAERMGCLPPMPTPEKCDCCGLELEPGVTFNGQRTTDAVVCQGCATKLRDRAAEAAKQAARMRDPFYVPTTAEALADPAGFVSGMTELGGEG